MADCGLDHGKLSGLFCHNCGCPLGVPREPGEIKVMRERLKRVSPPRDPRIVMSHLLVLLCIDLALKWALGTVTDEDLLKLLDDRSDKLPPPDQDGPKFSWGDKWTS